MGSQHESRQSANADAFPVVTAERSGNTSQKCRYPYREARPLGTRLSPHKKEAGKEIGFDYQPLFGKMSPRSGAGLERAAEIVTCDQASFFQRSAKEKQRETRRSVGGQSGFYSEARKKYDRHSRVAILSRSSEKITPDRRLRKSSPKEGSGKQYL